MFAALAWFALATMNAPADPAPLKVCLVSGSEEYDSDSSLSAFQGHLEALYPVKCVLLKAKGFGELPGLEALDDCDVALFFTRRLTISGDPLERVKRYALSKKPIVAVRTASHGFQNWLEFDPLVLGGHYTNHHSNDLALRAKLTPLGAGHPAMQGVKGLASRASLYKVSPLAEDCKVLLMGGSPEGTEPVAWSREKDGKRVFYTSLGAKSDFENGTFRRMLANSLFWAAGRDVPKVELPTPPTRTRPEGTISLTLRTRSETSPGHWEEKAVTKDVPVAETAIVICDMWDKHWCKGATDRGDVIARTMAPLIDSARKAGVQIVHAPSDCMDFYADTPQRRRMQLAPAATPPANKTINEPPLPIDDSDGGCDTNDPMYLAWTRQNPRISVREPDGVTDNGGECFNLFRQQGIKTVIVMGVHTNMCVLNRSFAIRQMTRWGFDCVLVRDLTDTMYNPAMRPKVPHEVGTDLVVEHIEKYWAPSTTAAELTKALPK